MATSITTPEIRANIYTAAPEGSAFVHRDGRNPRAYYFIDLADRYIGTLSLDYDTSRQLVKIHDIDIPNPNDQRKGYGTAVYKHIPELPLPDGSKLEDGNFKFVSGRLSIASTGLWNAFVRNGLAIETEGSFEMLPRSEWPDSVR